MDPQCINPCIQLWPCLVLHTYAAASTWHVCAHFYIWRCNSLETTCQVLWPKRLYQQSVTWVLLKTIERRSSSSSSFVTVYCSRTARKPMDRERNRVVRQQRKGDMKKRAVGYEDPAKPVWVSAPFIAVAATTAFLIAGHLLSRRPGVQLSPFHLNPKSLRPKLIEKFADQKKQKNERSPRFFGSSSQSLLFDFLIY